MARESQGLQVLLIVFVMLTVVLGVTTYLYNKRADEQTKAAVAAASREKEADTKRETAEKEREDLKGMIGSPEKNTDEIKKEFAEDMKTFGNEKNDADKAGDKPLFDPSTLHYRQLLAGMHKVVQDRTLQLLQSRANVTDLQARFQNRENAQRGAIEKMVASYDVMKGDYKKSFDAFAVGLQATQKESAREIESVVKIKNEAAVVQRTAEEAQKSAQKTVAEKEAELAKLLKEKQQAERKTIDVPSGEITWVSQPNKVVWINRGRADSLQRQIRFTVYSAETSDAATARIKGTVEVTQIEGDHMAQCRILDDKLADPIMAGDKVFTTLWSPGQQNHFAVTGIMNLDGDGRNQYNVVSRLITEHGGVVDCFLDAQGHKQGQITSDTRFVVVGDAPDKSSQEFMKNHGEILRDAERNHMTQLKLGDFKQQMGYQKSSSVERFGSTVPSFDGARPAAPKTPKAPKAPAKSEDSGT